MRTDVTSVEPAPRFWFVSFCSARNRAKVVFSVAISAEVHASLTDSEPPAGVATVRGPPPTPATDNGWPLAREAVFIAIVWMFALLAFAAGLLVLMVGGGGVVCDPVVRD